MENHRRQDGFQALARNAMATRTWGDAYGHCLVAMGKVEAMVDPVLAPWDVSAVSLIVEEAGGMCTDFEGTSNPRNQALSSNGLLHPLLLETFKS
jgi:myo-inositol-1(or 4)-monophosphatase